MKQPEATVLLFDNFSESRINYNQLLLKWFRRSNARQYDSEIFRDFFHVRSVAITKEKNRAAERFFTPCTSLV